MNKFYDYDEYDDNEYNGYSEEPENESNEGNCLVDKDDDIDDEYEDHYNDELLEDEAEDETENETETIENGDDLSDWSIDGLDKTYDDKDFDLGKAQIMLYSLNDKGEVDIKTQREAVRYANFFAKKGSDEAKNFIVSVIQKKKENWIAPETVSIACNSFVLFFRNYVRREIEKHYIRQPISATERFMRVQESVQECFAYIMEHIDRFDPSKGKITTLFNGRILRGITMEYEAKRKGRGSKQTMKIDKIVANAQKDLATAGITPTVRQIAMHTGKNVDVIINSKIRMAAENTMKTIDDPDFNNTGGKTAQSQFVQPERSVINKEETSNLVASIEKLPDIEKTVFLLMEGFQLEDGDLVETDVKNAPDVAESLNIKPNEVRHHYNMAQRKLKNMITNRKEKPHDKLLSGRFMTFNTEEKDDTEAIEDIVAIF